MNPLYEQMKTSVFERMSLAPTSTAPSTWARDFPISAGPKILASSRASTDRGSTNIRRRADFPMLREAVASPLSPSSATRSLRRSRLRDERRYRGARCGDPRDDRTGRRSDHLHAGIRQLCADDPPGRGHPCRGRPKPPTGASTSRLEAAIGPRPARSCSTTRTIRQPDCSGAMS